ncbi:MAG: hypothetical protein KU38_08925 [Sulfurovum sp. FS08-3]|nr:MAG: hypothetical protein KU38_08925 [Sulfurovum sp. FS08-3]
MIRYLFAFWLLLGTAWAHKINLFISQEGERVEIYSYFANGNPCKKCQLLIKNHDTILLKGVLNDEGKYQYLATHKNLEIIVNTEGGHSVKEEIETQNLHPQNLKSHLQSEQSKEQINAMLGLLLIFLIFFLLKKIKQ